MVLLYFISGFIIGSFTVYLLKKIRNKKTGYGFFKIEPYDNKNDELYKVNIRLTPDQNLLKVKDILLHKENSHE